MSRLRSTTLQIGDLAPAFALFAINEQLVHLAEVLDEVPLLLLFAPGAWSPNSRRQIEELSACYDRMHAAGVGVLAIVTQDARSLRRRLATEMPPFPILADENREAARSFGVFRALSWDGIGVTRPATFLIDRAGIVRFMYVGERDADLPETEALIRLVGDVFQVEVPDVVEELPAEEAVEPPTEGEDVLFVAGAEDVMRLLAVVDDFASTTESSEQAEEGSPALVIPDSTEPPSATEPSATQLAFGLDGVGPATADAESADLPNAQSSEHASEAVTQADPPATAAASEEVGPDQESAAPAGRGTRISRRTR